MKGVKLDLTGLRFGKLVVLREIQERKRGYACWRCLCDCGNEKIFTTNSLTRKAKPSSSCGCLWKKPVGESARHKLLLQYKRNARTRSREWALTDEQFFELTLRHCHYCGCQPSAIYSEKELNGSYMYNGVDRKDDSQGYVSENVVTCCKTCNWAKGHKSYTEFMDYLRQLIRYHSEKGTFNPLFRIASTRGV